MKSYNNTIILIIKLLHLTLLKNNFMSLIYLSHKICHFHVFEFKNQNIAFSKRNGCTDR